MHADTHSHTSFAAASPASAAASGWRSPRLEEPVAEVGRHRGETVAGALQLLHELLVLEALLAQVLQDGLGLLVVVVVPVGWECEGGGDGWLTAGALR
jgi:hypothetical protein